MNEIFSYKVVRMYERATFWRENVMAVVIQLCVLERMLSGGNQFKCQKFYRFAMRIGLSPVQ